MTKGTIKWYSTSKKFGFITNNLDEDVFFRLDGLLRSEDPIDDSATDEDVLLPQIGDIVEFKEYLYKDNKRAKKIIIKQRSKSVFTCSHCNQIVTPQVIITQNSDLKEKKIGREFEQITPVKKICPNCHSVIDEYSTPEQKLSFFNKFSAMFLILIILWLFSKFFIK